MRAFAPFLAYCGFYWCYNVLNLFEGHPAGAVICWDIRPPFFGKGPAGGREAGGRKHLEFLAGGDERTKLKMGYSNSPAPKKNHSFVTNKFFGCLGAGRLRRRILQAFQPACFPSPAGFLQAAHAWKCSPEKGDGLVLRAR